MADSYFSEAFKEFIDHGVSSFFTVTIDWYRMILDCNDAFASMLMLPRKPVGTQVDTFLAPESVSVLDDAMRMEDELRKLVFLDALGRSNVMDCALFETGEQSFFIAGEKRLLTETDIIERLSVLNNELNALTRDLHRKNKELEKAFSEIRTLRGLIPICSSCKKIRDDNGYWENV